MWPLAVSPCLPTTWCGELGEAGRRSPGAGTDSRAISPALPSYPAGSPRPEADQPQLGKILGFHGSGVGVGVTETWVSVLALLLDLFFFLMVSRHLLNRMLPLYLDYIVYSTWP